MPKFGRWGKWKKNLSKNKGKCREVINEKPLFFC